MRVPVTTVPKPETVKERSTARRGAAEVGTGFGFGEDFVDFAEEHVEALAGGCGEGDDFGLLQDSAFEGFDSLHFGEVRGGHCRRDRPW